MNSGHNAFGERLQSIRRGKGMTLEELAGLSGLSVRCIEDIERGHRDPLLTDIEALARELGVGMAELVASGRPCITSDEMRADLVEWIGQADEKALRLFYSFFSALL